MSRLKRTAEVNIIDLEKNLANLKWDLNSLNQMADSLQNQIRELLQGNLTNEEYEDIEQAYTEYSGLVNLINKANTQMKSVLDPITDYVKRNH